MTTEGRNGRPILSRDEAGQTIEHWMLPLTPVERWLRRIMKEPHPGVRSESEEPEKAEATTPQPPQGNNNSPSTTG